MRARTRLATGSPRQSNEPRRRSAAGLKRHAGEPLPGLIARFVDPAEGTKSLSDLFSRLPTISSVRGMCATDSRA